MNRKEEQWRNEGALYALRVVTDKGIDGLKQDLKMRGVFGISLLIPHELVDDARESLAERITIDIGTVALWTLYEGYGWREKRLKQFYSRFNHYCEDCTSLDRYGDNYVRISDMAKELQKRCKIESDIDAIKKGEKNSKGNNLIGIDVVMEVLKEHGQDILADELMQRWKYNREA